MSNNNNKDKNEKFKKFVLSIRSECTCECHNDEKNKEKVRRVECQ